MKEYLQTLTTNEYGTNPVTLPATPTFATVFLFPPNATVGQKMLPGTYELKGAVITFLVRVEGTLDVLYV